MEAGERRWETKVRGCGSCEVAGEIQTSAALLLENFYLNPMILFTGQVEEWDNDR